MTTIKKEYLLFTPNESLANTIKERRKFVEKYNIIPRFLLSELKDDINHLHFRSYQIFTQNFLNPNTSYKSLLLKWETGIGKTIGAIGIALEFINEYKKEELLNINRKDPIVLGSVIIIGFTKEIFKSELLKYPELGFINENEIIEFNEVKTRANSGVDIYIEQYKKLNTKYKKRLSNRRQNGFFKFYGYKELASNLFQVKQNYTEDISIMSENKLKEEIQNGNIMINKDIVDEFKNSLIICDEIHNAYNSQEQNNWGLAIQILLKYNKNTRSLFLSATPINNTPTETIDLIKLLMANTDLKIPKKSDIFSADNKLIKGAEDILREIFRNRISFIKITNPRLYASRSFNGETLPGLSNIRFRRCYMNKPQELVYNNIMNGRDILDNEHKYVMDLVIPQFNKQNFTTIEGLSNKADVLNNMRLKTTSFAKSAQSAGLTYNEITKTFTGDALNKDKLLKYMSSKYYSMVISLLDIIKHKKGKVFIYHNYLHFAGTYFITEILKSNGFIEMDDAPMDDTICVHCGKISSKHEKDHDFVPARMLLITSDNNKQANFELLEKFNRKSNIYGDDCFIIIGSRLIKESYSMNSIRNLFVMSRPDNIPILIQIIGRAIRFNSHSYLPVKDRHVDIHLFVLSNKNKKLTYDEQRYIQKLELFDTIKKIEQILHEVSIESTFYYDSINKAINKTNTDILTINNYKAENTDVSKIVDNTTFMLYVQKEIDMLVFIIKRLFIEYSPLWTYEDLYNKTINPPFYIELNNKYISQSSFNVALTSLLFDESDSCYTDPIFINDDMTNSLLSTLYNTEKKIFNIDGARRVIIMMSKYYCLALLDYNNDIVLDIDNIYRPCHKLMDYSISVRQYIEYDRSINYINKKQKFINKWNNSSITLLDKAINDFDTNFHTRFMEDCIEYVYKIWTIPNIKKHDNHSMFIKFLYYYDLQGVIIWGYMLPVDIFKYYEGSLELIADEKNRDLVATKININKSSRKWLSENMIAELDKDTDRIEKLFTNNKRNNFTKKINAEYVPVGHIHIDMSRIYTPKEGWLNIDIKKSTKKYIENNIIVGYDDRQEKRGDIKFKIREPINDISIYKDTRKMPRGIVCSSNSKKVLLDILEKLNITPKSSNTKYLCETIRSDLLYKELKEREKNTNIKWFYFNHESRPDMI